MYSDNTPHKMAKWFVSLLGLRAGHIPQIEPYLSIYFLAFTSPPQCSAYMGSTPKTPPNLFSRPPDCLTLYQLIGLPISKLFSNWQASIFVSFSQIRRSSHFNFSQIVGFHIFKLFSNQCSSVFLNFFQIVCNCLSQLLSNSRLPSFSASLK